MPLASHMNGIVCVTHTNDVHMWNSDSGDLVKKFTRPMVADAMNEVRKLSMIKMTWVSFNLMSYQSLYCVQFRNMQIRYTLVEAFQLVSTILEPSY